MADRYIIKRCNAVHSHRDGGFIHLFEINMKSETKALLRVLKSVGSQDLRISGFSRSRCFLSLQSSPPISFPFSVSFSFPHQTLSFSKNWEIVGIWYFPSHPQLIYKLLLAPQVVVNQDMRALAAKRLESKQRLLAVLRVQCLFCLYFKCCHSMSSEIGLPVRDQTFCKYQIPNELLLNAPSP